MEARAWEPDSDQALLFCMQELLPTCRQLAVLPQQVVGWHGPVVVAQLLQTLHAPAKVARLVIGHMCEVIVEGLFAQPGLRAAAGA